MTVTITIPEDLGVLLRRAACAQDRSAEAVALDILRSALLENDAPTIDDVIAFLRSAPPNPVNFRPARGSLAEALAVRMNAEFDRDSWETAWSQAEAEIEALSRDDECERER